MPRCCSSSSCKKSRKCKKIVKVCCKSSKGNGNLGLLGLFGLLGLGGGDLGTLFPCLSNKLCPPPVPVPETLTSAQFHQLGAQPAPAGIPAGQPLTFTTAVLPSTNITSNTGLFAPFTISGTVFNLAAIGRYQISFHATFASDGAIVLYAGPTVATMTPLSYSLVNKATSGVASTTVIIETVVANTLVSLNAAAGNVANIVIGATGSTTNTSSTSISFVYLGNQA